MTESQAENLISIIQQKGVVFESTDQLYHQVTQCTEARMMLVNLWISQNQFNAFIIWILIQNHGYGSL